MWQHPQNMYKHLYVVHQVQHDTKKGIAIMSLQLAPRRPPKNHCKSTNFPFAQSPFVPQRRAVTIQSLLPLL
jgi:hypothetical protein